jgi:nucleoside-diphosphate-sugar epimerase
MGRRRRCGARWKWSFEFEKILVTGGTGFLGGAVSREFRRRGYGVTATGRDGDKGDAMRGEGISFIRADLANELEAHAVCRGQDVVIHCAALSSPWGSALEFHRANVVATRNVVNAALAAGAKRLVHVSTPSIYFRFRDQLNLTENSLLPRRSVNAYAKTKLEAERIVDRAARNIPVVILRPRAIFGPGDTAIFPRLLRVGARGRLPIIGDGNNLADLTYIDCAVAGLIRAVEAPEDCCGQAYNLTNGESVRLWDLIGSLFRQVGLPEPRRRVPRAAALAWAAMSEAWGRVSGAEPRLTRFGVGVLAYSQTFDIRKARELLGYAPPVSMAVGVERFVSAHRSSHGTNF